jgi:hypothetical protein
MKKQMSGALVRAVAEEALTMISTSDLSTYAFIAVGAVCLSIGAFRWRDKIK